MTEVKGTMAVSPFGNPDGSRASIFEIQKDFVTFGGSSVWGGLATKSEDLTARVIVGRKGSGKTIYLRCLQAYASEQESLYADQIQQSLPSTENIIKFCQFFDEGILTEKWMILWHRAILRSVLSHLMHSHSLREHVDLARIEAIKNKYKGILRDFGTVLSIYSQVSEIILQNNTSNQITKYLDDPLWMELESIIGDLIKDCPPICLYIDAVDEEFAHAPMYWHRCQKGLFYQTMRLLRDAKLGGRLHIVICIRDIVMSSVYKSEHRTRYHKEPHIRILNWDKEAIRYFFQEKVRNLDSKYFRGDHERNGKNISTWLGISSIYNEARSVKENILDYLLRHTRLLPRDIVILGNSLCHAFERAKSFSEKKSTEQIIRRTVSEVANFFGNEQLTICGNQIASNAMPKHAAQHGYSGVYTGNQEYIRGATEDLKLIIDCIGKDKFTQAELRIACHQAKDLFGQDSDTFSVLWQNGLLGYKYYNHDDEPTTFYSETKMDEFQLPLDKKYYLFHSCLIDSVNIRPIGSSPIRY